MPLWAWSIAWAGIGNPNSYSNHDGYLIMFNIFKYIHFYGSISLLPGGMRDIKFKARTLVCLRSYSKPRLICILLWDTELKKEGRKRRERERERDGDRRESRARKKGLGRIIVSLGTPQFAFWHLRTDCCFTIRASLSSLWWVPIWILIRALASSSQDKNPNMYARSTVRCRITIADYVLALWEEQEDAAFCRLSAT